MQEYSVVLFGHFLSVFTKDHHFLTKKWRTFFYAAKPLKFNYPWRTIIRGEYTMNNFDGTKQINPDNIIRWLSVFFAGLIFFQWYGLCSDFFSLG